MRRNFSEDTIEEVVEEQEVNEVEDLDYDCCEGESVAYDLPEQRYLDPAILTPELIDNFLAIEEFGQGYKLAMKWAGYYNALILAGLSTKEAFTLCINEQTGESNLKMAKAGQIQQKKANPLG